MMNASKHALSRQHRANGKNSTYFTDVLLLFFIVFNTHIKHTYSQFLSGIGKMLVAFVRCLAEMWKIEQVVTTNKTQRKQCHENEIKQK